jgi:hypothetical protein
LGPTLTGPSTLTMSAQWGEAVRPTPSAKKYGNAARRKCVHADRDQKIDGDNHHWHTAPAGKLEM